MPGDVTCPGCRLKMPANERVAYTGYYNCSAEGWSVYSDVLGAEFTNAVVFSQVHQMTVDAYALQHAGGSHPDKSVAVHLAGLYAAYHLEVPQREVPRLLQRLADNVTAWPHYPPPHNAWPLNIMAVALSRSPREHIDRIRKWSRFVWQAWSPHHAGISQLVSQVG